MLQYAYTKIEQQQKSIVLRVRIHLSNENLYAIPPEIYVIIVNIF